jgi:predicted RND superfamily exporter protein
MKASARVTVTGELTVVASQATDLIRSQFEAMFLAFFIITGLMMIQMRSAVLGLIALVPNIPAVGVVFGIMGWLGISLDSVTVFAATVAIGLAVDNTVQYMNQLKREMRLNPDLGIEECVIRAYRLASKPMASWTTVTLFGFLALVVSPFKPVVFFGVLGCASLLMGLFGDLLFMQSLILSSSTIRNAIKTRMENGPAETDVAAKLTP